MEKKKISVLSIVLYVFAGLAAIFMVLAIMTTHSSLAQQQVPKGYELQVIYYYISNVSQYGLFAVVLFALGWILQTVSPVKKQAAYTPAEQPMPAFDGEFTQEINETENTEAASDEVEGSTK